MNEWIDEWMNEWIKLNEWNWGIGGIQQFIVELFLQYVFNCFCNKKYLKNYGDAKGLTLEDNIVPKNFYRITNNNNSKLTDN